MNWHTFRLGKSGKVRVTVQFLVEDVGVEAEIPRVPSCLWSTWAQGEKLQAKTLPLRLDVLPETKPSFEQNEGLVDGKVFSCIVVQHGFLPQFFKKRTKSGHGVVANNIIWMAKP